MSGTKMSPSLKIKSNSTSCIRTAWMIAPLRQWLTIEQKGSKRDENKHKGCHYSNWNSWASKTSSSKGSKRATFETEARRRKVLTSSSKSISSSVEVWNQSANPNKTSIPKCSDTNDLPYYHSISLNRKDNNTKITRTRKKFRLIEQIILLARSWHALKMLCDHLLTRSTVEDSSLATFVVRKVVSSFAIQVLDVYCVTSGTNFDCRSSCYFCQTWSWGDFSIRIVAEFWCRVVHFASHFFVLVCSWTRDLFRTCDTF
jgi:hypothetical protein